MSIRARFEQTFAGLLFAATTVLVMGGTIAACLQNAPLAA